MDENLKNQIKGKVWEAIERFDFNKVELVMEYLNWTWCGKQHSPTKSEMISHIFELTNMDLTEIEEKGATRATYTSGGFRVDIDVRPEHYEKGTAGVAIEFILEYSETFVQKEKI